MTPVVLHKLRILKKIVTAQMEYAVAGGKLIHEKPEIKISWHCLFNIQVEKGSLTG
jgi:hypothetical protein